MDNCDKQTEVYSRVCGFFRPVQQFNRGKKAEFHDRKNFLVEGKPQNKKTGEQNG